MLKRRVLIKKLEKAGWYFYRHGANHDIYICGDQLEWIPRHADINEELAKAIIRKWNL